MNTEQPEQPTSNRDWIEQELGGVNLGDARNGERREEVTQNDQPHERREECLRADVTGLAKKMSDRSASK